MNQEKTVFICEDSTEGIFTAVYDGWMEAKKVQIQIHTCEPENMELLPDYIMYSQTARKPGG